MHFTSLFSPGQIGPLTIRNCIVMAPMATNYADKNGAVTDAMVEYYRERARGGAGLIIIEAACVDSPRGREGFNQLNIDHPAYITGLRSLTEEIKAFGSRTFLQLFHAGRQTNSLLTDGNPIVAPSAVPCPMMKDMPLELDTGEIKTLINKFIKAAVYACQAGFDGVELHAAHGYLINQFLSPDSNRRGDEYGGSLDGRMRFLLDILRGIKAVMPQFPVSIRLNIDDFIPGGLTLTDGLKISRELEAAGADVINCSCGTYASGLKSIEPSSYPEGWRIYLAEAVKSAVKIPVIGGGMIHNPEKANHIVADNQADFVFLGRSLLADPYWPQKAAEGRVKDIRPCITCNNCINYSFRGLAVRCTVNPYTGREKYYRQSLPVPGKFNAVVVGGGPAGIQAALALNRNGIKVRLYERHGQLGGSMNLAGLFNKRILVWRDYLVEKIAQTDIDVVLNHKFDLQDLEAAIPDIMVIAAGSIPQKLKLEDDKLTNAYMGTDILQAGVEWSNLKVLIIGGGSTGCELAEILALHENQVTIIEKEIRLAQDMEKKNRRDLLNRLTAAGVKALTARNIIYIDGNQVMVTNAEGLAEELSYDRLVWAVGFKPDRALYDAVKSKIPRVFLIGDAREVRGFRDAILEGETVVSSILNKFC